jgi:hypothetical protein
MSSFKTYYEQEVQMGLENCLDWNVTHYQAIIILGGAYLSAGFQPLSIMMLAAV